MAQRNYNLKRTIETKVRKSKSLCGILRDLCKDSKDKHFLHKEAMTAVVTKATPEKLRTGLEDVENSMNILTEYKKLLITELQRQEADAKVHTHD
jgi:hypothetical protein